MKKITILLFTALFALPLTVEAQRLAAVHDQHQANLHAVPTASQSVSHDAITFNTDGLRGAPLPQRALGQGEKVWYQRPAGVFYTPFFIHPQELQAAYAPYLYVPANREVTFKNTSVGNFTNFVWNVQHYDFELAGTRNPYTWTNVVSRDLKYAWYQGEADSIPILNANRSGESFSYFLNGYNTEFDENDNIKSMENCSAFLFSSVDPYDETVTYIGGNNYPVMTSKYFSYSGRDGFNYSPWVYYTGLRLNEDDTEGRGSFFGKNIDQPNDMMAIAFEKPEHTYGLNKVYALGFGQMKRDKTATLTARIYRLDEVPQYGETAVTINTNDLELIGEGEIVIDRSINKMSSMLAGDWSPVNLTIPLYEYDDILGLKYEVTLTIDFPILVTVSGFQDEGLDFFTFLVSRDNEDEGFGELGYLGNTETGELKGLNYSFTSKATGQPILMRTAPSIGIGVLMPMLDYLDLEGNVIDNYRFAREGETAEIHLVSTPKGNDLIITTDDDEPLPDWLSYTFEDDYDSYGYTNETLWSLTAAPMPAGMKSRSCRIKLSTAGNYLYFTAMQGDGLFGDVNNDGIVNVTDVNLLVSAALNGTCPDGYDLSGDNTINVTDINLAVSIILNNK